MKKSRTRKWINFARYSSPPIGRARQMEVVLDDSDPESPGIYMKILYGDGHEYEGWLNRVKGEEE